MSFAQLSKRMSSMVFVMTLLLVSNTSYAQNFTELWQFEGDANGINGLNGVLRGGAGFAAGIDGQALSLSGANTDFVTVSGIAQSFAGDLTIEFWMNPTSTAIGQVIARGGEFEVLVYINRIYYRHGGNTNWVYTGAVTSTNTWSHVAITRSVATNAVKIYVNGVAQPTSGSTATAPVISTADMLIGAGNYNATTYRFPGRLDHMAIYDTVLDQATITEHFADPASLLPVGSAPVASDGILGTMEDVAANGSLVASDVDGDPLTYSIVTNGSLGTAVVTNAATGDYTYTPNAHANGIDTFTFVANDGYRNSASATITVTITSVEDAPVANDFSVSVVYGTVYSGILSAIDPDGDALTYSIVTNGSLGSVVLTNATTGAFTYTPNANVFGTDSFTFQVSDGTTVSNIATVSVEMTVFTGMEAWKFDGNANGENGLNGTLQGNAAFGAGKLNQALSLSGAATDYVSVTGAPNLIGDLTVEFWVNPATSTGLYQFLGKNGEFDILSSNGRVYYRHSGNAWIYTGINMLPANTWTHVAVTRDTTNKVLKIYVNGLEQATTGAYTTTPAVLGGDLLIGAAYYNTSQYRLAGSLDNVAIYESVLDAASIQAHVANPNDLFFPPNPEPVASDGTLTTTKDVAASGMLVATDPNGEALTYSIVTNGSLGTAVVTNAATGAYTYTPNANAFGTDTFTFMANDGTSDSAPATITVTITPDAGDAPVASDGTLTTLEDNIAISTLIASDPEGNALTYTIVSNGALGTAVITDTATGAYTYTPNANVFGTDTFTFMANDGTSDSAPATITVTIVPVDDDAPIVSSHAFPLSGSVTESGVLSASDPDGQALTYSIVTNGSQGTVVITNAATGEFIYTPNADFVGRDSFTFQVSDGVLFSDIATVTIVMPAFTGTELWSFEGDAIGRNGLSGTLMGQTSFSVGKTGQAITFGGADTDYVTVPGISQHFTDDLSVAFWINPGEISDGRIISRGREFEISLSETGVIRYAHGQVPGYTGNFTYWANTKTSISTDSWSHVVITRDITAQELSIYVNGVKQGLNKSDVANYTGTMESLPPESTDNLQIGGEKIGVSRFSTSGYKGALDEVAIYDWVLGAATVEEYFVDPVSALITNLVPVTSDGTLFTQEDMAINGTLVASDPEGDLMTYRIATNGSLGTAVITNSATGEFTYTPSINAYGTDTFTFVANDGQNRDSMLGTITVTIASDSGDAPIASNLAMDVMANAAKNGTLPATDPDGDIVTYSIVSNGTLGTAVITDSTTGEFTYTPAGTAGADSFTFQVSDGGLISNIATVTVRNISPLIAFTGTELWQFEGDANGVNGLNGTLQGAAGFTAGKDGQALSLSGAVTDFVTVSGVSQNFTSDLTIEFWIYIAYNYSPYTGPIIARDGEFEVMVSSGRIFYRHGSDSNFLRTDYIISNNTWEHVAITRSVATNTVTIYVNGEAQYLNGVTAEKPVASTADLLIGAGYYNIMGNRFPGYFDNIAIYEHVLDADSIAARVTDPLSVATNPNFPPVVSDGSLTVIEDSASSGTLVGTDLEDSPLSYSISANGSLGTAVVTNAATGAYTYTPNLNAFGTDTFTFVASDGQRTSAPATVTVTITPVQDAPVASNQRLYVWPDTVQHGLLSVVDPDGDALSYDIITNGALGTVVVTNTATGEFTYTPNAGVTGMDSFTYQASDGVRVSNIMTVTVEIAAFLGTELWEFEGNAMGLNGHNGTLVGAADFAIGKEGQALSLGDNSYVTVPGIANNFTGDLTIEFWVNTGYSSSRPIISRVGEFEVRVGFNTVFFRHGGDTMSLYAANRPITSDTWTHVAITREVATNTITIYVDGVAQTLVGSTAGAPVASTGDLLIGSGYWDTYYFEGMLDELAIYEYVLDAATIQQHATQ